MNKVLLKKIKDDLLTQKCDLESKYVADQDIDTDGDETDEVQANIMIEINNQLTSRNNAKLMQIENALEMISNNTYGVCEDCEEMIHEKRLLANPYVLTCISCAEEREIEEKQRKRF